MTMACTTGEAAHFVWFEEEEVAEENNSEWSRENYDSSYDDDLSSNYSDTSLCDESFDELPFSEAVAVEYDDLWYDVMFGTIKSQKHKSARSSCNTFQRRNKGAENMKLKGNSDYLNAIAGYFHINVAKLIQRLKEEYRNGRLKFDINKKYDVGATDDEIFEILEVLEDNENCKFSSEVKDMETLCRHLNSNLSNPENIHQRWRRSQRVEPISVSRIVTCNNRKGRCCRSAVVGCSGGNQMNNIREYQEDDYDALQSDRQNITVFLDRTYDLRHNRIQKSKARKLNRFQKCVECVK